MAKERSRERASELRQRAEKILTEDPQAIRTMAPADIQEVIHEFSVYQIELEMQNAELCRVQLELQEARDKYLSLYDFAPTGYFTLDHNSLILDVNLAGSELLGSEKQKLIGVEFTASISPDSQDAFYFHYREVLKTGLKGNCELKMLKADGTPFHAQLISLAVSDKDGKINQYRTAVIDITGRKKTEEALRESEQQYRLLIDNANESIIVAQDGLIKFVNKMTLGLFGRDSEQELIDRPYLESIHPDDRHIVVENHRRRIKNEAADPRYDFRVVTREGIVKWVEMNAALIEWQGKPATLNFLSDITERKRVEKALRESEENFRRSLDDSPLGIRIVNSDGEISYTNRVLLDIYGYASIEELKATPSKKRYTPESYAEYQMRKERRLRGEYVPSNYEISIVRKDGKIRHLEVFRKEVLWNGKTQFQVLYNDVTERKRAEEELELRAHLLDNATDSIFLHDLEGNFIYVNEAAYKTRGFKKDELLAMNIHGLDTPEYARLIEPRIKDLIARGEAFSESAHLNKNGSVMHVEIHAHILNINGKKQILSVIRDITERKQAEEMLQESELRFRQMFEEHLAVMLMIDPDSGKIIDGNPAAAQYYGYSREKLKSMNINEINQLPVAKVTECIRLAAAKGGNTFIFPHRLASGEIRTVEVHSAPIKIKTQTILFSIIHDITERKQAEDALKASEEQLNSIFESMNDGIVINRQGDEIVQVNKSLVSMLSYTDKKELVGKHFLSMIAPGDREKAEHYFTRILPNIGSPKTIQFSLIRKDGTEFPAEFSNAGITDAFGNRIGDVTVVRDITERQKMEMKLLQADRLASIGELASGIAHEINNPLTSVMGFSEMMLRKDIPESVKADVVIINSEAQRMAKIVKNLLIFARKHEPVKEPVNLQSVIEKTIELRAYEQKVNNIIVETMFAPDLPEITGDYYQLQQVVLNIIVNAEYFMLEAHQKGKLLIKSTKNGDIIRLSFTDDGPGISPENFRHLFNPFFTTKPVGKGTGLGLSICQGIIVEHSGNIYVESEMGKGTTFIIELPISPLSSTK